MAMYHGYVSRLCIMAMYIILFILRIIRNDSSESKKVNFWKMLKILFWYRIQNLRKILWRFAQKSLIFVHSASSYGRNKFCIEFRSQRRIFRFLCLDSGGLKNLLVDLVRKPFLTDQKNIQKKIQEGVKSFNQSLGLFLKRSIPLQRRRTATTDDDGRRRRRRRQ